MQQIKIIGIRITKKLEDPNELQDVLTMYGNIIRTRIGLNEESDNSKSDHSIILLELVGTENQFDNLQNRLDNINGIEIQSMSFKPLSNINQ